MPEEELEEDEALEAEEADEHEGPATAEPAAPSPAAALGGLEAALQGNGDAADVRAQLGSVASGLAEQLSSITEEMNKIRQELYGESGIGGIAQELEKLRSGGLGNLLDESGAGGSSASSRSLGGGDGGSAGSLGDKARRRKNPDDRDKDLEELRRKLMERRSQGGAAEAQRGSLSLSEKLMLVVLVLICFYAGSQSFRGAVKRGIGGLLFGDEFEMGDEDVEMEDFNY
eukprot:TRINITY_DN42281_c0_g2_i1.p1 TRINITY_DN42281_c0_g2~~TRINITY_DN42281_c0_g2_i1.p1  ORF type:complete len:229 (-),score=75.72 TRINITY_DN42281_c0_g2_i1:134-820(-)